MSGQRYLSSIIGLHDVNIHFYVAIYIDKFLRFISPQLSLSGVCYFHEKGIIRHIFMLQVNVTLTDIWKNMYFDSHNSTYWYCPSVLRYIHSTYQKDIGSFMLKYFVYKKINIISLKSLNRNIFAFMRLSIYLRDNDSLSWNNCYDAIRN